MPEKENGGPASEKPRPVINFEECKGCERCIAACPAKCLRIADKINSKGIKPAEKDVQGVACVFITVLSLIQSKLRNRNRFFKCWMPWE